MRAPGKGAQTDPFHRFVSSAAIRRAALQSVKTAYNAGGVFRIVRIEFDGARGFFLCGISSPSAGSNTPRPWHDAIRHESSNSIAFRAAGSAVGDSPLPELSFFRRACGVVSQCRFQGRGIVGLRLMAF